MISMTFINFVHFHIFIAYSSLDNACVPLWSNLLIPPLTTNKSLLSC